MNRGSLRRACWTIALVAMSLVSARPASAHNSWIVASQNSAPGPCTVRVAFVTTEEFPASQHATKPQRVAEWMVRVAQSKRHVRNYRVEGLELAAEIPLDRAGTHVIAASLHPHFIEFDAGKFEAYLKEEHAEEALSLRHGRGQRTEPGRMYYTKLTKTFVEVGDRSTEDYRQPVGHTLEIVPLSNPCRWRVGGEVTVRVLYKGEPAAHVCVSSGHPGLPPDTYVENVFTDSDGLARFTLTRPGLWYLRTHLIRPNTQVASTEADSPHADWESFWSSITFRVHDRP